MEQDPAFWEDDRATSTSIHWVVENDHADTWSERWTFPFSDPNYSPLKDLGVYLSEHSLFTFFYITDCEILCHIFKALYRFGLSYLPDLLP